MQIFEGHHTWITELKSWNKTSAVAGIESRGLFCQQDQHDHIDVCKTSKVLPQEIDITNVQNDLPNFQNGHSSSFPQNGVSDV